MIGLFSSGKELVRAAYSSVCAHMGEKKSDVMRALATKISTFWQVVFCLIPTLHKYFNARLEKAAEKALEAHRVSLGKVLDLRVLQILKDLGIFQKETYPESFSKVKRVSIQEVREKDAEIDQREAHLSEIESFAAASLRKTQNASILQRVVFRDLSPAQFD